MKLSIRIVAVLLMCVAVSASAASDLFITLEGKSFWVSSFSQEGKKVVYQTREGGPKRSIAIADLDIVVPSVKKGRKYTPEQVEKGLARAKRAIGKHPRLRKQIELLKQQWDALKSGKNDGIPGEIEKLQGRFEMSDKGPKSFQDIAFQMQMLSFKDAAGQHAGKIESVLTKMQLEVFGLTLTRIESMVGAGDQTLENYRAAKKLSEQMKMAKATDDQKETLGKLVERCRKNTAVECLRLAKTAFFAKKDVNGYLRSMTILGDVEYSPVPTEADKKEIQKTRAIITSSAAKYCKDYKFTEKGYPLDGADQRLPEELRDHASTRGSGYGHGQPEHCFMLPTKSVAGKKTGDWISIPVRLIFNRDPLPDTRYHLMGVFSVPGSSKRIITEAPVRIGDLKNGRMNAEFSAKVPWLEPEFHDAEQRQEWNNSTYFRLCLVYKGYRTAFSEKKDWVAASGECRYGFKR